MPGFWLRSWLTPCELYPNVAPSPPFPDPFPINEPDVSKGGVLRTIGTQRVEKTGFWLLPNTVVLQFSASLRGMSYLLALDLA